MNGLKKILASQTYQDRKKLADGSLEISLLRQSEILDVSRSSLYYQPKVNQRELQTMNLIDQIYTDYPFYGSRNIRDEIRDRTGLIINRKPIQRLMRKMGLEAIYPKKRLSFPDKQHQIYPYLLRSLKIIKPNQVWSTDITYIKLETGFAYLVALMDWFSRYVLNWKLSSNLESDFCIQNLKEAVNEIIPEIHNSDQGSQFTSQDYTGALKEKEIKISMDGRGRYLDNIFVERLWRTVKYENVYLNSYLDIHEAQVGLKDYFDFYNHRRRHSSLNKQTPAQVYFKKT